MSPSEWPKESDGGQEFHPENFREQMGLQKQLIMYFAEEHPELSKDGTATARDAMAEWIESGMAEAFRLWTEDHSEKQVYTPEDLAEIMEDLEVIRDRSLH